MITKEGLKLPLKEEEELINQINREIDIFALDYDNVPVWLQEYKRSWLAQGIKPFATFPYKITKTYITMFQKAFDGTRSWSDRLASIMALGTIIAASAYYIDKKRGEQKTPPASDTAPSAVSSAGRINIGEDEKGKEKFTRISKYPFINLSEAGLQVADGNVEEAYRVMRDMIGRIVQFFHYLLL